MIHDTCKKIIVIVIVILLFSLTPLSGIAGQVPWMDNTNRIVQQSNQNNDYPVYDFIIITPGRFTRVLKPLVDHKNEMGVLTRLVTLDDVNRQMFWRGRDEPEKIKYFIKQAIESWGIKYVLFVGNSRNIPVRYIYNAFLNTTYTPPEEKFISELYYADIYDENGNFSSWDTNNNNIYGEWFGEEAEDKHIDLYPDICVGRLACRNKFEVMIMVNKIIKYEKTTHNSEWFNRIVVVAGDTAPESWDPNWTGYEGEENTLKILENMTGFEPTKLWASDDTLAGPRDVIKAINKGCGFLYLEGHGNPRSWGVYSPNGTNWINGLSTNTMIFLHNNKKLPVCVVGGCSNLKFDVSNINLITNFRDLIDYFVYMPECWGWKFTSKIGGGSIATIGCTGEWMIKEDKDSLRGAGDFLNSMFFWEYGVNGTNILGEVWKKAISNYLDNYTIDWSTPSGWDFAVDTKTVQDWILLGDPSLKIGGYN